MRIYRFRDEISLINVANWVSEASIRVGGHHMREFLSAGTALLFVLPVLAQTDARAIVEKSLAAENRSDAQAVNYTYKARNTIKELDGKGKVKSTKTTLEEILYLGGKRYIHVLEKDGKPLTGDEAHKEQARFDRALADAAKLTDAEKQKRRQVEIDNRRKNLNRSQEIPAAYDFSMVREEVLEGRPAWVIHASPKKGYAGKDAALLKNMEGDLWIDKADYHWAKVSAHALDNFSLGLFLARVGKDSQIRFESTRVNNEIWLPKFVAVRAEARIALVKKINVEQELVFSDYKRYSSDSQDRNFNRAIIAGCRAIASQ